MRWTCRLLNMTKLKCFNAKNASFCLNQWSEFGGGIICLTDQWHGRVQETFAAVTLSFRESHLGDEILIKHIQLSQWGWFIYMQVDGPAVYFRALTKGALCLFRTCELIWKKNWWWRFHLSVTLDQFSL